MSFIAYFSSSNRSSLRSGIVISCHILIFFNLEHFHRLSLSFMTNFNKMTVIFSLIFPYGYIQNMHLWLEHYIRDVVSFSECHIWGHMMFIFSSVIIILITQSIIVWFLHCVVTISPLTTTKQFVGIHLKTMKISWPSSDFSPSFSIHWWFLTWSMQNNDFPIPALSPYFVSFWRCAVGKCPP